MKKVLLWCTLLISSMCSAVGIKYVDGEAVSYPQLVDSKTMKDGIKNAKEFGKWSFVEFSMISVPYLGVLGAVLLRSPAVGVGLGLGLSAGIGAAMGGVVLTCECVKHHSKHIKKNLPAFKKKIKYSNFLRLGDNDLNITRV